jgi:large subunit ribosomal protein L9
MQVILKQDVDHLGYAQDVVDVKRGYWRNYLRPRGLAETATPERVAELVSRMERRRALDAQSAEEAESLKELLGRTTITVSAHAGPQGKLFGSVTAQEIVRTLENTRKLRVDAKKVKLDEPIKALGTFAVPIDLGHGVTAELSLTVSEIEITQEERERMAEEAEAAERAAIEAVERQEAAEAAAAEAAANPQPEADAAEGDASAEQAPEAEAAADEAPAADADAAS